MLYKPKIVLKTHIFCKIFRFLYRSFVSFCKESEIFYNIFIYIYIYIYNNNSTFLVVKIKSFTSSVNLTLLPFLLPFYLSKCCAVTGHNISTPQSLVSSFRKRLIPFFAELLLLSLNKSSMFSHWLSF